MLRSLVGSEMCIRDSFLPDPKHSTTPTWLLCGLFIAAAIYVRYSAVFSAFGTGVGIALYLLLYGPNKPAVLIKPLFKLALLLSLPVLVFGQLMYRTFTMIGTFDRYSGLKDPESLVSTLKLWAIVTSKQLGFSSSDLIGSKAITILFLLFILLITVFVIWFFATSSSALRNSRSEKSLVHFRIVALAVALHTLTLVAYLSYASMTSSPLAIISRYTFQIYPGLYAVFCFMLYTLFNRYSSDQSYQLTGAYTYLKGLTASCLLYTSPSPRDS